MRYRIGRAIAFYLSVLTFFILLPVILSYSLGYQIDFRNLMIYKTGIMYLKSQPTGALICVNGRMLSELTPVRIEELKPGVYKVEVKREGFYPWQRDLAVRPNMVTKVDDIVLFPLTQEMRQVIDRDIIDYAVSGQNIYYMTGGGLLRSATDGTNIRKLSAYSGWPKDIIGRKFSPGGDKILFFNSSAIWVIYLNPAKAAPKENGNIKVKEILKSPNAIIDAFWYSESRHIVFATDRDLNVAELEGEEGKNVVTLYKFNARPKYLYYNDDDSVYFADIPLGADSREKYRIYRLDLKEKFFDRLVQRLKKEFNIIYEEKR